MIQKKVAGKVRIIHRLIKVTHHLANVEADNTPSLRWLMDHLARVIVSAFLSPDTALRIRGIAKDWTWTTLSILRDHYKACLDRDLLLLLESGPGDWARCNLGRRLQDTTVLRAALGWRKSCRLRGRSLSLWPDPPGPTRLRPLLESRLFLPPRRTVRDVP